MSLPPQQTYPPPKVSVLGYLKDNSVLVKSMLEMKYETMCKNKKQNRLIYFKPLCHNESIKLDFSNWRQNYIYGIFNPFVYKHEVLSTLQPILARNHWLKQEEVNLQVYSTTNNG